MPATIFDTNLEEDVLEGDSETLQGQNEPDTGRSIDAYRPPLPELPVRASEEEDAEDELLDEWPYPQPGEWGLTWKADRA